MQEMNVYEFLKKLYKAETKEPDGKAFLLDLCDRGLADAEDVHMPEKALTRGDAARLSHLFLLKEKNLPDIADITDAEALRDLYDCRVCANHIAQVFLRGIMDGIEIPGMIGDNTKAFLLFDTRKKCDASEAESIIERLESLVFYEK